MPTLYSRSTSHVISLMPSITLPKRTTPLSMFPLYSSSHRQSLYLYDTVLVICLLWKSEQKLETLHINKYQCMACNKSSINNYIKYYYLLDQKHYWCLRNVHSIQWLRTMLHLLITSLLTINSIMTLLLFSKSSVIRKASRIYFLNKVYSFHQVHLCDSAL